MKKLIILLLCICSLLTLVACEEKAESEAANHIKLMLGAVAKDKTGKTELIEVSKEDGSVLMYAEIKVLEKGEFESKFNEKFGYNYKDKIDGTDDEKVKAKSDRNTLLSEALDSAYNVLKDACATHGAELIDDETMLFVYDSDTIIEKYGYMFGALVYVTPNEATALRGDDAVDSVSEWRYAFFYNSKYKAYELYELE